MKGWFANSLLISLVVFPITVTAESTNISIKSPIDGTIVNSHIVNITGTATGLEEVWSQSNSVDFNNGEMNHTKVGPSGDLLLDGGLYDDFQSNDLNASKWIKSDIGGITSEVENQTYIASGTCIINISDNCEAKIVSSQRFQESVSASLICFNGSGNYYQTQFGINDSISSYVAGFTNDAERPIICIETVRPDISGGYNYYYDPVSPNNVNISISWNPSSVSFQIGNFSTIFDSSKYPLENGCNCELITKAGRMNDSVSAVWDNVIGDRIYSGTYVSEVCDTDYPMPRLNKISWNITTPLGSTISLAIRSSNNSNMNDPAPWAPLNANQVSGLPTILRYIQYCVTFVSSDGIYSPGLHVINIFYDKKPVSSIEVSIDKGITWLMANGTDSWYILLKLQEDMNIIWVRALHPIGDFDIALMTIYVDTTPPTATITIYNNRMFTNDSSVIINVNASDKYGVASMIFSENMYFTGASWQNYCVSTPFKLSSDDGIKTIFAKFKDNSGWESEIINDTIILDTLPPTTIILPLPNIVKRIDFFVCWTGEDNISGLRWYDVQYKDNNGAWTNWQNKTISTNAIFLGINGHHYSFRVRAQDNAGNYQTFSEIGSESVTIQLPIPTINILRPYNNTILHTSIEIIGTSSHQNTDINIIEVQIKIDDGPWQPAQGTTIWKYKWDTSRVKNGSHVIYARSYDGYYYSPETAINVTVKNPTEARVNNDSLSLIIGILSVLSLLGIYLLIVVKLKR